jgi:uncharacterized membrane protein YbhN (UPF0104 family)
VGGGRRHDAACLARWAGRFVRRYGSTIAGIAVLAFLMRRVGGGPFVEALHAVSAGTLLAALAIGVLTTAFSAWRWTLTARALGLRLSAAGALGDYYRALFLNAVLPGGVLGDVDRALRHGREVGTVGVAARAVVLERAAGQVVLFGVGATVLLFDPATPYLPLPTFGAATAMTALLVAALLVLAVAAGRRLLVRARALRAARGQAPGWSGATGWAGDVRQVLGSPGRATGVLVASAVVLAGHLATFVVAARAAGSAATAGQLLPLGLLALLAMSLPFNVGGWGPREGVTAWAFTAAGLGAAQGVTTAVVYGLFALVAALPGALVPLVRWAAAQLPTVLPARRPAALPAGSGTATPARPARALVASGQAAR